MDKPAGRAVADKRMTAQQAAALVRDGDHVAIVGGSNAFSLGLDLAVLLGSTIVAILIAARLYPGLAT